MQTPCWGRFDSSTGSSTCCAMMTPTECAPSSNGAKRKGARSKAMPLRSRLIISCRMSRSPNSLTSTTAPARPRILPDQMLFVSNSQIPASWWKTPRKAFDGSGNDLRRSAPQRTQRQHEGSLPAISHYEAFYAVLKMNHIEIDQKPQTPATELQIRKNLRLMYRGDSIHTLNLHNNRALD